MTANSAREPRGPGIWASFRRPSGVAALGLAIVLVLSIGCRTVDSIRGLSAIAGSVSASGRFAGYETVVSETHQASFEARERALRSIVAKDSCWPHGAWGDTMWTLVALYLNEKTDAANDRLLKRAQAYCDARRAQPVGEEFLPEKTKDISPWAYFALTDYVRMLCLFRVASTHHPGRLRPRTEAAMKEALWWLVKADSKVADASLDNLLVLLGTENHDLTRRPNYYLIASVLKDDPAFRDRRYDDGHTAAEHFAAYNDFFREWPRKRAMTGLWFEVGSDTYQKYSWPALFNLHELAPDPLVRERFGMLLDLAFIEEAQVAIQGRRGGGRSRAGYGKNNFEGYKNLLYAPEGIPAGCSHSKVIETSRYQLPAAAILLRKLAFPAEEPFVIANRVLGELGPGGGHAADSALVNYAYRTPHYLLGSTLQNPALSMPHSETGEPVLKYAGISRQKRWSGMLFHAPEARPPLIPAAAEMCAVYSVVEKTRGGRPQHPHWSFQHENVLFLQRIAAQQPEFPMRMGSYSTGRVSIRFHGRKLEKVEEGGWIFAGNGTAFVAVRFLDGGYEWDDTRELASPVDYDRFRTTSRVLIHAGDVGSGTSFEAFRAAVLVNPLTVERDRVEYQPAPAGPRLECFRYDADAHEQFRLPRIGGKVVDLRPEWTYRSPYLNGRFGGDRVMVTVGPVKQVYDFGARN
ncbi:MAG: hypothetical protein HN742_27735 [Lentisphaerae bacterium]|jgi:hypothetical protein|nr:hypothetical protein [Lentisphaerota bacterium]MBT5611677.1 hypothetical protein [Lentisphaerota bacterium]MBT7054051.1 hypothetical protein [Lentisphaerota bacterium]MBT7845695.1 hypothetical protein [Lentisphaerota bacterium]